MKTKTTKTKISKARVVFSVLKASEGGESFLAVRFRLEDANITDVRREHSPYIGHYALSVPADAAGRAGKIIYR